MVDHIRKSRTEPNAADPLAEPTLTRRLHAAYLHRGLNRSTFAKQMEVAYTTVNDWDTGEAVPSLEKLIRASEIVGFSLDQLAYGYKTPKTQRMEPALTTEAIRALLRELSATAEQIEALGTYAGSAAGQFTTFTRSYVAAFVDRYTAARDQGDAPAAAIDEAKTAAANARATHEALALRMKPVTTAQLEALGKQLRKELFPDATPDVADVAAARAPTARGKAPARKRRKSGSNNHSGKRRHG